jgi:NADPH:quinone reductase-like Zn-dependent oxidoreductase
MKAVVVQQDRTVAVEDKPDPQPKPNEIVRLKAKLLRNAKILSKVIKVKAFGQNPTDWKHAAFLSQPGDIIGCDAVGEIVSLGSEVPTGRLEKGTRVGTFTRGS